MTIIKNTLIAATAAASVLAAGSAAAENRIMMGFNPFQGILDNVGNAVSNSGASSSVSAPSYMVGMRTSDQLMPYAFLSIVDTGVQGADTIFSLGGGARYYLDNVSQNIRPFAGAAIGIVDREDTGFGVGAFFGAEAMITESFSVSGQIGAEIADSGRANSSTAISLGTANVMFNLYF
ncbi:hypothetical protein [Marinobacter sp.]|uniref:hypothetical protein n=1 Tax=Marinobacter sp. TaxID=50741 RepID=UPI002B46C285|nr:hypothetical protein [Marinobacter sp.]HKK56484.1 hypothetical protein [Marinobacter sp.]